MKKLTAVILAAGEARRMRSSRPKVLHPLCGRPPIAYPLAGCRALGARAGGGCGRVAREGERPVAIGEHRDATEAQRAIREIGTSVYCFEARRFWPALSQVTPQNDQGEYYLTDVIGLLQRERQRVEGA